MPARREGRPRPVARRAGRRSPISLVFFAVPTLIMVLASFRTPGEFGGLAPLVDEAGQARPQLRELRPLLHRVGLRRGVPEVDRLRARDDGALPRARLPARRAHRAEPEEVPRPAAAARDSSVLEQLPDSRLRMDDPARAAGGARPRRQRRARARSAIGPVPLLFSSFAVLVCLVYVHLPFMVLPLYANLEKHDQALLDAAQDLGAGAWQRFWRITFPLSLPGVYAGRRARVHSGARHLRDPRHPGRPGRHADRQPHQAAVPRDARLAVRQRALDRADAFGAGRSPGSRPGSDGATWARRRARGKPVRRRAPRWSPPPPRATRSSTSRSRSSSSTRSTIRGSTPNGSASRSAGTTSSSTTKTCWPRRGTRC